MAASGTSLGREGISTTGFSLLPSLLTAPLTRSCYSLSGLSVAQWLADEEHHSTQVYGAPENLLEQTSCVFNIRPSRVLETLQHFSQFPSSHEALVAAYPHTP